MPRTRKVSPYAKLYNAAEFTPIRAFLKNSSATHHNTIVPQSVNYGPLLLGAIPTQAMLDKMAVENDSPAIIRVSLLTDEEESSMNYSDSQSSIHMSLFDHSAMDPNTGNNITIEKVQVLMGEVANLMKEGKVVYFHCMAGHSRSCFGMVSFLYLHPEFLEGQGLSGSPSLREIAGFVKIKRSEVAAIDELKSGQKGLLGLLALHKRTEELKKKGVLLELSENEFKRIAQDVAFMLYAPLDRGFRDETDRIKQEENFAELYRIYKQGGHNLLLDMLPEYQNPYPDYPDTSSSSPHALNRFAQLSSIEQAHFAILVQSLISQGVVTKEDLKSELHCASEDLMQQAVANKEELTAGDQIEVFRTFGPDTGLTFVDIAERIIQGDRIDKYNAGIQLAELLSIAKRYNLLPTDESIIESFVSQLSVEEQEWIHNFLFKKIITQEKESQEQISSLSVL